VLVTKQISKPPGPTLHLTQDLLSQAAALSQVIREDQP